ncbi:MAG: hypothetical protein SFX73_08880 [Kofleriaceae bacterium]|nr:hypothetical protein [Kofleriaceae bacterium]
MQLATSQPFSFAQTLAFIRRFPPCQGDFVLTDDALTGAVTLDGRPVLFTLRSRANDLAVETTDPRAAAIAADFVGST